MSNQSNIQIFQDIHPVLASPFTLSTSLTEYHQWFPVIGLKDAFFCIPLDKQSQGIFAFEWENPQTGEKTQLTWIVLPQRFRSSPAIFGSQLAKKLDTWKKESPEGLVLQYVDDILLMTSAWN